MDAIWPILTDATNVVSQAVPILANMVPPARAGNMDGAVSIGKKFGLTISAQNCNSLNLTGISKNFDEKIAAITSVKTDIIFLSDIRQVNQNGVCNDQRTFNAFKDSKNKSYYFAHNSSKNSRGTAILIGHNLDFQILDEIRDPNENFLLLKVKIGEQSIVLGSIYGPNGTDNNFFTNLELGLRNLQIGGRLAIVLGGDWNTTWDTRPPAVNIDIFKMAAAPNTANCERLHRLSEVFNITDPFRILYPEKIDFSYSPFGTVRKNRSRIDFFLVSEALLEKLHDCTISSSPLTELFDHKNIAVKFCAPTFFPTEKKLSNNFLDEPVLKFAVESTAKLTHLLWINTNSVANIRQKNNLGAFLIEEKARNNEVRNEIKRYFSIKLQLAREDDGSGELIAENDNAVNCLRNIEVLLAESEELETYHNSK